MTVFGKLHCIFMTCVYNTVYCREVFHGRRWLEDPRFFAPMVEAPCGVVFIHDFVQVQVANNCIYGRVNKFYNKVLYLCYGIHLNYNYLICVM